MNAADARQALARLRPQDARDVNLVVYHNWDNTRRFLDSIDPDSGTLVTSRRADEALEPARNETRTTSWRTFSGARCAGRMVPLPRRHAVLHAAARRGHDQGRSGRPGGREVSHLCRRPGQRADSSSTSLSAAWRSGTASGSRRRAVSSRTRRPPRSTPSCWPTARGTSRSRTARSATSAPTPSGSAKDAASAPCGGRTCTTSAPAACGSAKRASPPRRPMRTAHVEIDNNIIRHGGKHLPLRRRPVDRTERRQQRHPQRNRRPVLHRHLRRLDLGLRGKPRQAEHVRLQPRASPRLGPAQRHGRHLHARPVRGHASSATTSSTTSTPIPTAAGACTPTKAAPASCSRTTSSTTRSPAASISTTARKTCCATTSSPSARSSSFRPRGSRAICRSRWRTTSCTGRPASCWPARGTKCASPRTTTSTGRRRAGRSSSSASRWRHGRRRGTSRGRRWPTRNSPIRPGSTSAWRPIHPR